MGTQSLKIWALVKSFSRAIWVFLQLRAFNNLNAVELQGVPKSLEQ